MPGAGIGASSGEVEAITGLDFLNKLFDETFSFTYDANDNITKITIQTEDQDGNAKTITLTLTYDASGNLTDVTKVVS